MFQSGLSCARSGWAKAIACVVGLATIGGTVSEAQAGKTISYYRFENGTAGEVTRKIADSKGGPASRGRTMVRYGGIEFVDSTPANPVPKTGETNLLAGRFWGGADPTQFNYPFPLDTLPNATIEFWINPGPESVSQGTKQSRIFLSSDGCCSYAFYVLLKNIDNLLFIYIDFPDFVEGIRSKVPCLVDEWCFVAIVKIGDTYSIYINNRLTDYKTRLTQTATAPSPNPVRSIEWRISDFNEPLFGLLDEIRLSNEALRPSEFLVKQPKLPE